MMAFKLIHVSTSDVYHPLLGRNYAQGSGMFELKRDEDDASFALVESSSRLMRKARVGLPRNTYSRGGSRGGRGGAAGQRGGRSTAGYTQLRGRNNNTSGTSRGGRGGRQPTRGRGGYQRNFREEVQVPPSVPILDSWQFVDEVSFDSLKSSLMTPPDVTTVHAMGGLERMIDIPLRNTQGPIAKPVIAPPVEHYNPTASADPYLSKVAQEHKCDIIATSAVLSLLMSANRTAQPWDILVRRTKNALYLDFRPDSKVPLLSSCETIEIPHDTEGVNNPDALCLEATKVARNVAQMYFPHHSGEEGEKKYTIELDAPYPTTSKSGVTPASTVYFYRTATIDNMRLCLRVDVDGYKHEPQDTEDPDKYVVSRTFNEVDPRLLDKPTEWRESFKNNAGATVLATEMKLNPSRVCRAAADAFLADADLLHIAYVSRTSMRDASQHVVLASTLQTPKTFAGSIRVTAKELWGSLKSFLELCYMQEPGKYVLLKDPMRPAVLLYAVPDDTFDAETGALIPQASSNDY